MIIKTCKLCGSKFTLVRNTNQKFCDECKTDRRNEIHTTYYKYTPKRSIPTTNIKSKSIQSYCECCGEPIEYIQYGEGKVRYCEAHRNEYKRALYNGVHNTKEPISVDYHKIREMYESGLANSVYGAISSLYGNLDESEHIEIFNNYFEKMF